MTNLRMKLLMTEILLLLEMVHGSLKMSARNWTTNSKMVLWTQKIFRHKNPFLGLLDKRMEV